MSAEPSPDPADLIPPAPVLRDRLARAMQEVALPSGLIRLSERVARRAGRPAATPPRPTGRKAVRRG